MSEIVITDEFQAILDEVSELTNQRTPKYIVNIGGPAGCGKSVILNLIQERFTNVCVCAPSGLAAANVGGKTFHSLTSAPVKNKLYDGLGVLDPIKGQEDQVGRKMYVSNFLKKAKLLLLDEKSMTSAPMVDWLDRRLQAIKRNKKPFGGVRIVLFGDDAQLPPVIPDREAQVYRKWYKGLNWWDAKVFDRIEIRSHELTKVFRQKDEATIRMLNRIRWGNPTDIDMSIINSKVGSPHPEATVLAQFRSVVGSVNRKKQQSNPNPTEYLRAKYSGNWGKFNKYPDEEVLSLKQGDLCMLTKNGFVNRGQGQDKEKIEWVNGDQGVFKGYDKKYDQILFLRLSDNQLLRIEQYKHENIKYDFDLTGQKISTVIGLFHQFPIRLAYAITGHKSQGQSLNRVHLELGDADLFCEGLGYTLLSRCRDWNNMTLSRPLTKEELTPRKEAIQWMKKSMENKQQELEI